MVNLENTNNQKLFFNLNDLMGYTALYLVQQSPYLIPDNLETALKDVAKKYQKEFDFDDLGYCSAKRGKLVEKLNSIFENTQNIAIYNKLNNNNDFIDLMAMAQNIAYSIKQNNEG